MISDKPLPPGWCEAALPEVAEVNPPNPNDPPADESLVSFIPMASVEALSGRMDARDVRPWEQVKKGYTRFQVQDVLFAKITPCMENGKVAIARGLVAGVGAGSTEFHVLRPSSALRPELLLHYMLQEEFRKSARARMTGTAGQLRVPTGFLEEQTIPVPPYPEQHRIVETIESYFTRLDDAVATLERAQRNLKRYRASVLKAAVEGRLVPTEAELARAEGRDYEPASVLLERILAERRRRWEEAELTKVKAKGETPKDERWKAKYKEPGAPATSDLSELPEGWCWATVDQVCFNIVDCPHSTPKWASAGHICIRTTEFRPGRLLLDGVRFVSDGTYQERIQRLRPEAGDILYSREGGILGIACRIPPGVEVCMGQRMMLMRAASPGTACYLMHFLNSPQVLRRVSALTGGSASPHLNVGDIRSFPVPLPPENEVVRIAGAIDGFLSVVDCIDKSVVDNLTRLARLRQSILKWAFEGRLVDQDPSDEPASVLLDRIRAERETVAAGPSRSRGRTRNERGARG